MSDFVNTIDIFGDDAVIDSIIQRTITEFNDNNIVDVGNSAFRNCTSLLSVDLPNCENIYEAAFRNSGLVSAHFTKVTGVGKGSSIFQECQNLKNVNFPYATDVPASAFWKCPSLETVHYPLATSVGDSAFGYCTSLKILDLPRVESLRCQACYNSSSLIALALRSMNICDLDSTALLGTPIKKNGTGYVYVPADLVESYQTTDQWSTYASQFRKLEEWTVDGTVTGELDITNRHMVRFFNDDGSLLGYKIVDSGTDATYSGSTPVSTQNASMKFIGFTPEPKNVTSDMDCYASFITPISLSSATWQRISQISADDMGHHYFSIGDRKAVNLSGTMGKLTLSETLYVYIIGFNHNSDLEGKGIQFAGFQKLTSSNSYPHVALYDKNNSSGSTDGSKVFNINHYGYENYGGWKRCDLRYDILGGTDVAPKGYGSKAAGGQYGYDATATCASNPVAGTLMSCLPADLRAKMKPITKYTDNVGSSKESSNVSASVDYLTLPSEYEMFGSVAKSNPNEANYQQRYYYYALNTRRQMHMHYDPSKTVDIWLRSPSGSTWCIDYHDGTSYTMAAHYSMGICPIFMV